ncbi:unnamed protein product [Triticum aestivum]|uniref:AtC3H23-like CCCH zinc finger domain-containing protein n=1 Tax=Triticum aestivum TaxID=4565 RepID=A0A7H4LCT4_WHEAT|nr:unnamed protein product [Triticum aestivum]
MTTVEMDMYKMVVQENGEVTYQLTDPTTWGAWAHDGHRLWASMPEDFWLYEYKVRMCPQPYSHDWTACPYAHKEERARRRDPRRFNYIAISCPEYRVNARTHAQLRLAGAGHPPPTCTRGLRCRFAHGVFELWLHPSRFRTRKCDAGTRCQRQICFFAHFTRELRVEDPMAAFTAPAVPSSTFAMPRTPPHILQRAPSTSVTRLQDVPTPQLFDDVTLQATPNRLRMLSLYYAITGDDVFSSPIATATAAAVAAAATTMPTMRVPLMAYEEEEEEDAKSVHYANDEDSLLNDYPHRDLIMDFMR